MYKVSDLLHFIIFADATNIFYLDIDPVKLVNTLYTELDQFSMWFKINKLSLNVTLTKFLGVIIDVTAPTPRVCENTLSNSFIKNSSF